MLTQLPLATIPFRQSVVHLSVVNSTFVSDEKNLLTWKIETIQVPLVVKLHPLAMVVAVYFDLIDAP
jgi:hypothetical protein